MTMPSSMTVAADAQFTTAAIFRPFKDFIAVYQGQDATIPIAMPGDLDPDAGKPGISPYLLRGIPVPYGAKVSLYLPMLLSAIGENSGGYVYLLHWRLRSIDDYVRRMTTGAEPVPYHMRDDGLGAPDTFLAPASPTRFPIPSVTESVLYQQTEPTAGPLIAGVGEGVANLRTEEIAIPDDGVNLLPTSGLPLLPPNVAPPFANAFPSASTTPLGLFQQGILDPATSGLAGSSIYRKYFTVAKGDELIISVVRQDASASPPNLWDFSSTDADFALLYSVSPGVGIYMLTGTNPS